MVNDIVRRLEALEAVVMRMIRVGVVTSILPEKGTVRVQLPDVHAGGTPLVTRELPVRFDKTCQDKQYQMPDVGEHVLCLFLPNGQEQGCVIGAIYSEADTVPVADPDKRHIRFRDGTWLEYDRKRHELTGHIVDGSAELTIDRDLTADVGGTAVARIGEDLFVDVEGNAIVTAGGELTAESATTIQVVAPLIRLVGNVTTTGADGDLVTVERRADELHIGDVEQRGDYLLKGKLHVTDLIVDNPIDGTLGGGA
ncbi:phage baseplate assembly protein V [Oceanidesulfovibrio marinus]|uniref:Phage baseplate assembly protein V n=1 Tax=Oceanidesulfovibrio marinus TaxID=370038 RepID=A0ABX6NKK1_9BACT|nr:phage baseplate assembly protein V [Oceanidesulfovibrio marinus]QJT10227.1 phage baseplate assembly protein V [Oceanidesulfovibrio marinus]